MSTRIKIFRVLLVLALLQMLLPAAILAQVEIPFVTTQEYSQVIEFKDQLKRDTPKSSFYNFLEHSRRKDYVSAAKYLDMTLFKKNGSKIQSLDLARQLVYIIDRSLELDQLKLSESVNGFEQDGLAKDTDLIGTFEVDRHQHILFMTKHLESNVHVWKFSSKSLQDVPELYEKLSHKSVTSYLPKALKNIEFLTLQLWQWIMLAIGLFLFLPASHYISLYLLKFVPLILNIPPMYVQTEAYHGLRRPLMISIYTILLITLSRFLHLTLVIANTFSIICYTSFAFSLLAFLFKSIDILSTAFKATLDSRKMIAASSVVPLTRRFFKIILVFITALLLLRLYDVNITALLAGLGVGGIAVALAAQKSLENLFSGVALMTDQPVRVGDLCRFDDKIGRIEDIGIRSTRIRTLDRSVVIIPNREFSQMKLENLTQKDKMKFETVLQITYQTSSDQLRFVLLKLRELMLSHPKVLQDDKLRVRFDGFGSSSLDIRVFVHVNSTDWCEFLAIKEDLLLRIIDIVEASGCEFAYPTTTLYTNSGTKKPRDKTAEAEAQIEQLRKNNDLPFPNHTKQQFDELRSSTAYPPEGSISLPPKGSL